MISQFIWWSRAIVDIIFVADSLCACVLCLNPCTHIHDTHSLHLHACSLSLSVSRALSLSYTLTLSLSLFRFLHRTYTNALSYSFSFTVRCRRQQQLHRSNVATTVNRWHTLNVHLGFVCAFKTKYKFYTNARMYACTIFYRPLTEILITNTYNFSVWRVYRLRAANFMVHTAHTHTNTHNTINNQSHPSTTMTKDTVRASMSVWASE